MFRTLTAIAALLIATPLWAADAPLAPITPPQPFVYAPAPSDTVMGNSDAPVTIVEYASLSCPHCAHFFTTVLPDLTAKYIDSGKVKLVYRDFPLNDPALKAAELIQCADKDRRHAFLKVLFTTQNKWAYDNNYKESLANIAALGGIGRPQFDACMNDKAVEKGVLERAKDAQDKYQVNSTPTFFINGKPYPGDAGLEPLSKEIDAALPPASKK